MKKTLLSTLFIAIFCSALFMQSCYREKDYDPGEVSGDKVITALSASPSQINADGISTSLITVKLPTTINDSTAVLVSTDAGTLLPGNVQSVLLYAKWNNDSLANQVQIALRAKNIQTTATLTVSVAGFEKKLTVPFVRIQPSALAIIPARPAIKAGYADEMIITVAGLTDTGTITTADKIDLTALNPLGNTIGYFRGYNPLSDSTGKCTFYFSLGYDTLWPTITLRATSANLYKETTIFFQH